jgi:Flp pilus assembly pilin Flp
MTSKQRGQSLMEYMILLALVGVASMGVLQVLSKNLKVNFAKISQALKGERGEMQGDTVRPGDYDVKDLGDFNASLRE